MSVHTLNYGLYLQEGSTAKPSIEAFYGPYETIDTAYDKIVNLFGSKENIPIGLTFAVKNSSNTITEYWFNGGTEKTNLVQKNSDGNNYGFLINLETQRAKDAEQKLEDKLESFKNSNVSVKEDNDGHIIVSKTTNDSTSSVTYEIIEKDIASESALTAEIARATSAETTNAKAISDEKNRATMVEKELRKDIDSSLTAITTDNDITVNGGVISANGLWENNVIPSGTQIEDILRTLLCQEIYPKSPTIPSISLYGLSTKGVYQVGSNHTVSKVSISETKGNYNCTYSSSMLLLDTGSKFNGDGKITYASLNSTYNPTNNTSSITSDDVTVELGLNTISYEASESYTAPTVMPKTNLGNETTKTGSTAADGTAIWTAGTATVTGKTTFTGAYPIYYGTVKEGEEPSNVLLLDSKTFEFNDFADETDETRIAIAYPSTMSIVDLGVYNSISGEYDQQEVEEYGSISDSTLKVNGTSYKIWRRTGKNFITSPSVEIIFNKKASEK